MSNITAPDTGAHVIDFPTRPAYRSLTYRYHVPKPDPGEAGLTWIEWCIEQQLSHLLDEHDIDTALRLLHSVNPALRPDDIEHLLDLADLASLQAQPSHRFFRAVDNYADALNALAKRVRGGQ